MEVINKREAWNKGKLVGQKPPLKPKDIWAIRIHLQNAHAVSNALNRAAIFCLPVVQFLESANGRFPLRRMRTPDPKRGRHFAP